MLPAALALIHLVSASTTVLYASVQTFDGNRGPDSDAFCLEGTLGELYAELNCHGALSMLLY